MTEFYNSNSFESSLSGFEQSFAFRTQHDAFYKSERKFRLAIFTRETLNASFPGHFMSNRTDLAKIYVCRLWRYLNLSRKIFQNFWNWFQKRLQNHIKRKWLCSVKKGLWCFSGKSFSFVLLHFFPSPLFLHSNFTNAHVFTWFHSSTWRFEIKSPLGNNM